MKYNYKIVIFGGGLYQEIPLMENEDGIFRIGTQKNCNVRFDRDSFFDEIEISFIMGEDAWKMNCNGNIYIDADGVMKLYSVVLHHGDSFTLKYKKSKSELFRLTYLIDFDVQDFNFDRSIVISEKQRITIGGEKNCDIYISNSIASGDTITLVKQQGYYDIIDNNSQNGVYINGSKMAGSSGVVRDRDFFMLDGTYFYLKDGHLYTSLYDYKIINGLPFVDLTESKSQFQYPKFERNVRIRRNVPDENIEVLPPKAAPAKDKKSFFMNILPTIISLVLMIVIRGSMSRNKMFIVYSASVMGMGVITSIISFIMDKKKYKEETENRIKEYTDYINERETVIKSARQNELDILHEKYQSISEEVKEVFDFDPRMFEKNPQDNDYLCIRLGIGTILAHSQVEFTKQEFKDTEDKLLDYPERLAEAYKYIEKAPVVLNMVECNAVGFLGDEKMLFAMLKNIVMNLSVTHFYEDVKFYFIFDSKDIDKFYMFRWLQNACDERSGIRNFMYNEDSRKYLLEFLYKELTRRESMLEEEHEELHFVDIIVFVMNAENIKNHPVSKYFKKMSTLGVRFIFFEQYKEMLPMECDKVIYLDNETGNTGLMVNAHEGAERTGFSFDVVADEVMENVCLKLGNVYVEKASLESTLHNITLFEMLDIMRVDDLDLEERWGSSKVYESMSAPLGIRGNGSIVYLDLSDKKDGPHGLVAGTTGSGKSEIIQTYILSMATLFHPYDVGFMIIDFKGGGMANQFKDLPHLMGTITNIDGREINRSLLSIKAELIKRQEIFSEAGVNNISDYIRKFKKGEVTIPMPHLIMVCDEFAELKAEYPDFMKEIVSAARIGRTLGVHLILATQKPAGVVDNQIWSNSRFKLCLKVATKEDSNEMLKSPLAAEIREPGRAYLQVGNNEVFELFQSAYSGAKATNAVLNENIFDLYEVNLWGSRKKVFSNKRKGNDESNITQLDAIIDYVHNYCEEKQIAKLKGICLPPLKDMLFMSDVEKFNGHTEDGICANIGIYDDPEQQTQAPLTINFSENNVYIAGASQMGKTSLIQNILYNVMNTYSPEDVNIYIVDCGNMALKVFEDARHVGGVVLSSEEEKLSNLIKMLLGIVETRKDIFSKAGLGTFSAYIEAGFKDVPQILVFIDNVAVFKEQFTEYFDALLGLFREGRSVGINFIATGTQANSIGFKALANFGTRLALFCTEKAEYGNLFDRCRIEPKETPGRGLCVIDKQIKEFQVALAFKGDKEIERVENMKRFILENAKLYLNLKAQAIPVVPKVISENVAMKNMPELYADVTKMPYAVDYSNIEYKYIDFMNTNLFAISGGEGKGKTNLTKLLLNHLSRNIFDFTSQVYIIDNDDGELSAYEEKRIVKYYTTDASKIADIADTIDTLMIERMNRISTIGRSNMKWDEEPEIVLIINNLAVMAELTKKKDVAAKIANIIKNYKKMKNMIWLANLDNAAIPFNANEILKIVKDVKGIAVFEDMDSIKIMDITAKHIRIFNKPLQAGDCYFFQGNGISRLKTILADEP